MVGTLTEGRAAAWNRDVHRLVGEPLRPEALDSVLIAIPGSSGDIVLTTTIIRHIKARNPRCRVSFAVKRSNLPLLAMCPGVDEAIEAPLLAATPGKTRRQVYLDVYAGRADAVIYPVTTFEDMPDLLGRYNFLEAMWLMAGIPDGVPPEPQTLWLTPPADPAPAAGALRRSLDAPRLLAEAADLYGHILRRIVTQRTVRGIGWQHGALLLRRPILAARHPAPARLTDAARRFVILSSDSHALMRGSEGAVRRVVEFLRRRGRVVLHNVLNPAQAADGTIPLMCSYEEFLGLRHGGVPFVGWRSGLCDIAAASPAPMAVIYPDTLAECTPLRHLTARNPVELFSFASMNLAADCVDLVCDRDEKVDLSPLAAILN